MANFVAWEGLALRLQAMWPFWVFLGSFRVVLGPLGDTPGAGLNVFSERVVLGRSSVSFLNKHGSRIRSALTFERGKESETAYETPTLFK